MLCKVEFIFLDKLLSMQHERKELEFLDLHIKVHKLEELVYCCYIGLFESH